MDSIKTIQELIQCYKKLPGIGFKTAERLAYATLNLSEDEKREFISAFEASIHNVKRCEICGSFYEEDDSCPICSDSTRDHSLLLVVADSKDIFSIEKTKGYHGMYFSLNGTLSPLKNKTPEQIGIPQLKHLVESQNIKEVILALPTDLEGETTALYIANLYKHNPNINISKLANGIPIGTNLEYLDNMTLRYSIQGRTIYDKGE